MITLYHYNTKYNDITLNASDTVSVKRPKTDRERVILALQGYLPSPFGPIMKNGENVTIWFKYGQKQP
jgi:hypothetical protein